MQRGATAISTAVAAMLRIATLAAGAAALVAPGQTPARSTTLQAKNVLFGDESRATSLAVEFHERLSSEIKDEISSKLASALRALKSRISRICGINELERRVSLAPEAV